MTTQRESVLAHIFGEGCDARIAGRGFAPCPYRESDLRKYWEAGWIHVHRHWAQGWADGFPDDPAKPDHCRGRPRLHPGRRLSEAMTPNTPCFLGLAR